MPLTAISGSHLRKMVTQASGTKSYISKSVLDHLIETKNKRFLKDNTKVTRQQATKIMKGLKAAGLANKVTSDAGTFVNKSFSKEQRRQDMIKKQNLAERNKEIAAEKAAEQAKGSKATPAKPIRAVRLASGGVPKIDGESTPDHELIENTFGSTNLKSGGTIKLQQVARPQEDEPPDLAID